MATAATVFAQTPNQKAEAEARSFLIPCRQSDGSKQETCLYNQRDFIERYVVAKAGSSDEMGQVANAFLPRADPDDDHDRGLGLPLRPIEACAWRMVGITLDAHYDYYVQRDCGRLPADDRFAARRRAEHLVQELRSTPAQMPSLYWEPAIAGLKPDPRIPPQRKLPRITDPAGMRAQQEGKGFFASCGNVDEEYNKIARENRMPVQKADLRYVERCQERQADFLDEYVRAKAGDTEAMRLVALDFYRSDAPVSRLGNPVRHSAIEECAWASVRAARDKSFEAQIDAGRHCAHLPLADRPSAVARVAMLEHDLQTTPARMPPRKERLDSTLPPPSEHP
jgi:hypothetical protein